MKKLSKQQPTLNDKIRKGKRRRRPKERQKKKIENGSASIKNWMRLEQLRIDE